MPEQAQIVAIGNELLLGDVLDTNSHWLCQQLTGLGAEVTRVCQVRDDPGAIREALRDALAHGAGLIITVGGLGPTEDDLTLEAVAGALGRALRTDPQALAWVSATYRELARKGYVDSPEMTPPRAKMARLPERATPLPNRVGAAPGVLLEVEGALVISLPGVPEELRDLFENALPGVLTERLGAGAYVQWRAVVQSGDESVLAPLLRDAARDREVHIKSRARGFGAERRFRITLSARGPSQSVARERVSRAWEALLRALEGANIAVLSLERDGPEHNSSR